MRRNEKRAIASHRINVAPLARLGTAYEGDQSALMRTIDGFLAGRQAS